LLRPRRLLDAVKRVSSFTEEKTDPNALVIEATDLDTSSLEEVEDQAIREVAQRQVDAGLDVINDGEFRRVFFTMSFDAAVRGFAPNDEVLTFTRADGVQYHHPARPVVAERLEKVGSPGAREAAFMAPLDLAPFKVTFPAPSIFCWPGIFRPGATDRAYADPDEMIDHVVAILREMIDETVARGASYIQLDFPLYPLLADPDWREAWDSRGVDLEELLQRCLRVDSAVVEGFPSRVRRALHLCRGNFRGGWLARGSLDPVADRLFALPYQSFLVEWDDVRTMGDYSTLRHVGGGPVVVLGIISTKERQIESEDELLRHIDEASRYLDADQLALSPQCGFASEAAGKLIDEDQQWRKLDLVGRIADRVWPR
jgi:5-methyltetrahydropteroyltriglutamate--homocysteine methyltransferase